MADVMMVGDGHNDIPAMEVVGWAVAMGNAGPDVIASARIVAGHVDADGTVDDVGGSVDLPDAPGARR